ncbi:MAG: hypothetical protein GTO45_32710 [Candidatus Aminicenantes bacterium]|nr:hypothetical protein [Candidatus Aminicenantes bacterium]NIM83513.1 hypothetical protein [Candidatus Aminicenantes bacterium]NIN22902.1 hypothetical protein [Candidatus Aminicenantes bacterium]NIN46641.1 hypothetical protein [Candidatus Aminicenantes bacterium]NIN89544.1 hypothetical protein [Candidatus Aminicenantes bacterium]
MAAYFSDRLNNTMPNPTPSFSNILLISKLVKVLQKIEKKQPLQHRDRGILNRGKDLISKIIEGARVVESEDFENALFPIEEGITTYGYALRTMKTLNLYEEAQESILFFKGLSDQLEEVESTGMPTTKVGLLKEFFLALGNSFRSEIHQREYQAPKTFEAPFLM